MPGSQMLEPAWDKRSNFAMRRGGVRCEWREQHLQESHGLDAEKHLQRAEQCLQSRVQQDPGGLGEVN